MTPGPPALAAPGLARGSDPRLLVVWGQYPGWIPPAILSARQVTLATRPKEMKDQGPLAFTYFDGFEPAGWVPAGAFDLAEYCDRAGLGRDFDFVIVFSEQDTGVFPVNLAAFACPKILLVGDTHHFPAPLTTLIGYARREGIDQIAVQFASHHLHWFRKAGFGTCVWMPGLITRHVPGRWQGARRDVIGMVGHSWRYHYRRHVLLDEMRAQGLPVEVRTATRSEAADFYRGTLIAFNCSLNMDVNIRNFEVLSSGGFLLTDRLPELTGHAELFRPGACCDTYDDADELFDKIAYYRRTPWAAEALALRGQAHFQRNLNPGLMQDRFRRVFFQAGDPAGAVPPDPRLTRPAGPALARRIAAYEQIQELHRTRLAVRVHVDPRCRWFDPGDCADLPRVRFDGTPEDHDHAVAD